MSHSHLSVSLAPVDRDVLDQLRREWDWVIPAGLDVFGMTRLGDWLLVDADGAVHLLDTVEAVVTQVASSLDALSDAVEDTETRDRLFLDGLAVRALAGRPLPRNHSLGFRVPPALGGPTDGLNIEIVEVVAYQVWTARVQRALAAVPVGAAITGVEVSESGGVSLQWRPGAALAASATVSQRVTPGCANQEPSAASSTPCATTNTGTPAASAAPTSTSGPTSGRSSGST